MLISYVKRKMGQRKAKKQNEPAVDKAARVTASATRWIAIFTLVSVLVNVRMFLVLRSQLREMHDATVQTGTAATAAKNSSDLQTQIVKGTQAAELMPLTQSMIRNFLHYGILNKGAVKASNISGKITVTRHKLPSMLLLGHVQEFDISTSDDIMPQKSLDRIFEVLGYHSADYEKIKESKQLIMFKTNIQFDDGFGTRLERNFCNKYLVPPDAVPGNNSPTFYACDYVPEAMTNNPKNGEW
jgi:hypothetical protein